MSVLQWIWRSDASEVFETYSPGASQRSNNTTRNHGGPQTPRALEYHAGDGACGDAVRPVVLAAVVSDGAVEAVVHHGDDTGGVAQERTPSCDGVEDGVQTQFRRCGRRQSVQALGQTPHTSHCERAEICDTGAVAEIIRPPSRRQE